MASSVNKKLARKSRSRTLLPFSKISAKRTVDSNKWKTYQGSSRTGRNISLALYALVAIALLVVIAKLISFITSLDQPYLSDNSSDSRQYSWDDKFKLNLVVKSDSLYVLAFQAQTEEVNLFKIPDETYLQVPYGYGSWPAKSIYDLGQSSIPKSGAKLLMDTISKEFAVPIDGYIILNGDLSQKAFFEEVEEIRGNAFGVIDIIRSGKTNLSVYEMYKLWNGIKSTRFDKVKFLDLGKSNVTKSKLLADGTRALMFDNLKLDPFLKSNFQDKEVNGEKVTVAVINTTGEYGLAEKAARIIDNIGGRVIFTGSINDNLAETLVTGKSSYTKTRLAQAFAPLCLEKPGTIINRQPSQCQYEIKELDLSRADVVVVLGQDFLKKYQ